MKGMRKAKKVSQMMIEMGEKYKRIGIHEKPRGLGRTSFPIPGRVKEPLFLVSKKTSAGALSIIAAGLLLESPNFIAKRDRIGDLDMSFGGVKLTV